MFSRYLQADRSDPFHHMDLDPFINTSLPDSPSTPTPFCPFVLPQNILITLQSHQGAPSSRNTAHSRGKGGLKPLFTAGSGGQQSSIHLKLGAWYFCIDQRWSPLHGSSSRAFQQVVAATRHTYFQNQETFVYYDCPKVSGVHSQNLSRLLKWAPWWSHLDGLRSCAENDFTGQTAERKGMQLDTQALLTTAWHSAGPAAKIFLLTY